MPHAGTKWQAWILPDTIPEPTMGRPPSTWISPDPTLAPLRAPSEFPTKQTVAKHTERSGHQLCCSGPVTSHF